MHRDHLLMALSLAERRRGFCAPNPSVGAVVVKNGQVVGKGFHTHCGAPHAEVMALQDAGSASVGATVYVSLEPCCHYGRTPPCTDLLIDRKVACVVYGYRDPNPIVAGRGEAQLNEAGISCIHDPLPEIDAFYQSYHYWTMTQKPRISAKIAMSLDGKIAAQDGKPILLTSEKAAELTHQRRKQSDALLTTLRTILRDDPKLNARLEEKIYPKTVCVLDRLLNFPLTAQLCRTAQHIILLHDQAVEKTQVNKYRGHGFECIGVSSIEYKLNLHAVVDVLGKKGFHEVWVEAGGILLQSFLAENLLQTAYFYMAPVILGQEAYTAFSQACGLSEMAKQIQWKPLGVDGLCQIDF